MRPHLNGPAPRDWARLGEAARGATWEDAERLGAPKLDFKHQTGHKRRQASSMNRALIPVRASGEPEEGPAIAIARADMESMARWIRSWRNRKRAQRVQGNLIRAHWRPLLARLVASCQLLVVSCRLLVATCKWRISFDWI